jgi:hypothetical protein
MRKPKPTTEARVLSQLECSMRKFQVASTRYNGHPDGDREQLAFEMHRAAQSYEIALDQFREFLMPRQGNLFGAASVSEPSR